MPCWIYLRGDPDGIMCSDSAEEIRRRVDEAGGGFFEMSDVQYTHGDPSRIGYVRGSDVAAVLPMHPRRYEAELDDPPDWYTQYDS